MVKLVEQPLYGYPYGFAYVLHAEGVPKAFQRDKVDFRIYAEMLQWCVERNGPMDPPASRFDPDFPRTWLGSDRMGFAFVDQNAAMEFKLRWFV